MAGAPLSVDAFAHVYYQDRLKEGERPTKDMRDNITRMCRAGTLKARKAGRKWLIEA